MAPCLQPEEQLLKRECHLCILSGTEISISVTPIWCAMCIQKTAAWLVEDALVLVFTMGTLCLVSAIPGQLADFESLLGIWQVTQLMIKVLPLLHVHSFDRYLTIYRQSMKRDKPAGWAKLVEGCQDVPSSLLLIPKFSLLSFLNFSAS